MQARGKFSSEYAIKRQPWMKGSGPRLMDLCRCTAQGGDGCYRDAPSIDEFKVLDTATREVGFFDRPSWLDSAKVQRLVEGHFGVGAYEVNHGVWVV